MSRVHVLVQEAEILRRHGNLDEAARRCRKALRLEPGNLALAALLGALLADQGDMEEALRFLHRVAAARPHDADAQFNLGVALQRMGRHEDAIERLSSAVALRGEDADALVAIGLSLQDLGQEEEAINRYARALALAPDHSVAHNNMGNVLQATGRHAEALEHYAAAVARDPRYTIAHNNLGNALKALGRYDEAIASYRRALAVEPDDVDARYYTGLAQLALGDYAQGWAGYECRLRRGEAGAARKFRQPQWTGREELRGKTILLHAEQGLGDVLQFARYAPLVAEKGAIVLLEVYAPLLPLMGEMAGAMRVMVKGEPLPQADFHCPLGSLPLAFGTRIDTIPPPLPAGKRKPAAGGLRVGVCWRGSAGYVNDRDRSMRLEVLAPLLRLAGIEFVSLQKDLAEDEAFVCRDLPALTHRDADFAATAEAIRSLDLVVSVDTAWAHWSASVGTPTWVLLNASPHWLWLTDREDSPWYPAARLFRQEKLGDWDGVVRRATNALTVLHSRRAAHG